MEVLIKDAIKKGEECLKNAGIADWKQDSFLLAEEFFGVTKSAYYMNPTMVVQKEALFQYQSAIEKRCKKIPLQHIVGKQEFMGLTFHVNENVLIPRQETELLVEAVLQYANKENRKLRLLDLCTGSGCIAISIDKLSENISVFAGDISKKALEVAKENQKENKTKVTFIESDLFENMEGKFDIIVSNPPYIPTDEIDALMDEVKNHDPRLALDGDKDGLKFYRLISKEALKFLNPEGMIFYEIGDTQADAVSDILKEEGFQNIVVQKDLAKKDRIVYAGKE